MFRKLDPLFAYVPKFMKTAQMKMFLVGVSGYSVWLYYKDANELMNYSKSESKVFFEAPVTALSSRGNVLCIM